MKHLRILGLAVAAVLALSAVAASGASAALPEFTGPFPKAFTSTSGKGTLETKAGRKVTCEADTNTGKITGAKSDEATVKFTGCKIEKTGVTLTCTSPGAKEGEIVVEVLSTLVYIKEAAPKEVGIVLKPKTGTTFVTFKCVGKSIFGTVEESVTVRGEVIGVITPINTLTSTFTLAFKQTKGVQEPTEYENEKKEKVKAILETEGVGTGTGSETWSFEQSGETTTDTLTTSETTEIKA